MDEGNEQMTFWIATRGGVTSADYSQGVFSNNISYSQENGLLENDILSLSRDNLGTLYAASKTGINYRSENSWKSLTYTSFPANIPNAWIRVIHTRKDTLYVGTAGGIGRFVNTVDGMTGATRWTSEYGISPLSADITAVFADSKGDQWFGTSEGLQKHVGTLAKEGWSQFTPADGLVSNYILTISEAPSGDLWVGTTGGVSIFSNMKWQSVQKKDGLASDTVYDIAFEKDSSAWLATAHGISHHKSGSIVNQVMTPEKFGEALDMQITHIQGSGQVGFSFNLDKNQVVELSVYDLTGKTISRIGGSLLPSGRNTLIWNCLQPGSQMGSGLFIYHFQSNGKRKSGKFILMR